MAGNALLQKLIRSRFGNYKGYFLSFTQFVIVENWSVLVLSVVKELMASVNVI